MIVTKSRITEEDYEKLLNSSKEEVKEYVLNVAMKSAFHPAGYGFYSPKFFKEGDEFFVSWEHFNSCD